MDLESLLNPAGESYILMDGSDHDIYQSVIDAMTTHKNIEINGGSDIINNNNIFHGPPPTWCDILQAVSTTGKYTDKISDPIACKMEVILGGNFIARTTEDIVLTDYFDRTDN